ncbi:MAG: XTP/dITP diphosphatase [Promethearchaeota archaeon]
METSLYFATGNLHKLDEAREFFEEKIVGLKLKQCKGDLLEIQADSLEEVVEYKMKAALKHCNGNLLVEDTGLFIPRLNGFPGVYSSFVNKTIGCNGILKLLGDEHDIKSRRAYFKACACLKLKNDEKFHVFVGKIDGHVAFEEKGNNGFGFDPIFIPDSPDGNSKTFAEMTLREKNEVSHRTRALSKVLSFLGSYLKH